jgi:hypothetical protein
MLCGPMRRSGTLLTMAGMTQVLLGLALASPAAAAGPRGLPTARLELGVSSDATQVGWMRSSGVPWKYRYQYLSGGANTSGGWLHWQAASAPAGQFVADYLSASGGAGYVPFLPYYVLLQSTPSSGADEGARDYSNLNNPGTMNAYFAAFKVLMQRAGAYGKPVVVQVEPDFWGFMQAKARALGVAGADGIPASVASSGAPDVAGYANTVAGFGRALLHLRDAFAPNVTMAVHASEWASGIDISTNVSAGVNAVAEADRTAAFLATTGSWDLVTTDVDDHDADWWVATGRTSAQYTHWWDAANVKFPNFHRWESWIGEVRARLGLPAMAWQVPVGNSTISDACDQASGSGHYRDNVAEYFLAHPAELVQAGLIAVLFGAGNACQTTPYNDGGFLARLAATYYSGRVAALPAAATPTPSPTPSATPAPTDTPATPATPAQTAIAARDTGARTPDRRPLVAAAAGGTVGLLLVGGLGLRGWRRRSRSADRALR